MVHYALPPGTLLDVKYNNVNDKNFYSSVEGNIRYSIIKGKNVELKLFVQSRLGTSVLVTKQALR